MFRVNVRRTCSTAKACAAIVAAALLLGACGRDEFATPPAPAFVHGERANPVPVPGETDGGLSEPVVITADQVEGDAGTGDLDATQIAARDDAGNSLSNSAEWNAFDLELSKRLVPANSAASVAVMVNGEIVHQAAYGTRVPGTEDPVETTDRFRIASISKTITSIVVLQLVDDGYLTLDQPVGRQVADYLGMGQVGGGSADITVRQLLSHTSGFSEHHGTFFGNRVGSCSEAARLGLAGGVRSGGFDYSNMNYCVLGLLIESVTGKAYEQVVDQRLLNPLGITGMRFTTTFEIAPDEVSHFPTAGRNYMEVLGAAGQWNATPSDLVRILNSVNPATPGWKALTPESMAAFRYRTPHAGPPTGYGLGIINYGGGTWGHTGTIEHAHSMVLVQPDGVSWAISVSGEYPSQTGQLRSIIAQAFGAAFG